MGDCQGKYAGQPHSFACAKCRRGRPWQLGAPGSRRGEKVVTTGKTRKQRSQGMNYHRWGDVAYQYRCLECDHVGWSRHPDVARLYRRQHPESEKIERQE